MRSIKSHHLGLFSQIPKNFHDRAPRGMREGQTSRKKRPPIKQAASFSNEPCHSLRERKGNKLASRRGGGVSCHAHPKGKWEETSGITEDRTSTRLVSRGGVERGPIEGKGYRLFYNAVFGLSHVLDGSILLYSSGGGKRDLRRPPEEVEGS